MFRRYLIILMISVYNTLPDHDEENKMRPDNRNNNQLREIKLVRHFTRHAEGSVLVEFGDTKVICTASVTPGVPPFLKDSGKGWVTAEYGMLPRSTNDRIPREAARGKQTGRTQEIQRLIGRALRAAVNTDALGENTITIDCDVIQADGGTRTASITGACVALADAITYLKTKKKLKAEPFKQLVASVSVGIYQGKSILDLNYIEDSGADTDMNVVMTEHGGFIEIQGTAEKETFQQEQLDELLLLAKEGIQQLVEKQKAVLGEK